MFVINIVQPHWVNDKLDVNTSKMPATQLVRPQFVLLSTQHSPHPQPYFVTMQFGDLKRLDVHEARIFPRYFLSQKNQSRFTPISKSLPNFWNFVADVRSSQFI